MLFSGVGRGLAVTHANPSNGNGDDGDWDDSGRDNDEGKSSK
jgi:hypothetical protein